MLDAALNVRVFQGGSLCRDFPHIASIYDNINEEMDSNIKDRMVSLGYFDYRDAKLKNYGKYKIALHDCNSHINDIMGKADKSIRYIDNGTYKSGKRDTQILKGFVPIEYQSTGVGDIKKLLPVKGAEKANYAVLKRTLADGDVVELTMKQAKNGKYEAVALNSTKGKTLAELPQVKEMLLKLDPLVKRFIKSVR